MPRAVGPPLGNLRRSEAHSRTLKVRTEGLASFIAAAANPNALLATIQRSEEHENLIIPSLYLSLLINPARETMEVRGQHFTDPGSTTVIGAEQIETFKYSDLNRVLKAVPGVQIQEEDGFGLRPNIGMRGVDPHRSRKILLMEDGVPSSPAPYAAPAAYYVPSMALIEGIEVTKGSSAIRFGPQTIGGAINFWTKKIPESSLESQLDLAAGSYQFRKVKGSVGGRNDDFGFLLLGHQMESEGFKKLANGGDTGFEKRDLMGKLSYDIDSRQSLGLKTTWSDEDSRETYLGLTRDDFERDPYQRYAASENDHMKNGHATFLLEHLWSGDYLNSRVALYRNHFDRHWKRFDGISDPSLSARTILLNPEGQFQHAYNVMRGIEDSLGSNDQVVLANNHRSYVSEGLAWDGQVRFDINAEQKNQIEFGLRFHRDFIRHDHTVDRFNMISGRLTSSGLAPTRGAQDKIQAQSVAAYIWNTYTIQNWRLSGGLRQEFVTIEKTDYANRAKDGDLKRSASMPGLGLFRQLGPEWGWLLGVYRGMGLADADDEGSGKPEESINYESGFRYMKLGATFDAIGFYNDYRNIKGTCSAAEGCGSSSSDKSYDGGRARIYGLELGGSTSPRLDDWQFPLSFQYTYTRAYFAGEFDSSLVDWGIGRIHKGDPIPYVPQQQLNVQAGVRRQQVQLVASAKYQAKSYDQALPEDREELPASTIVDTAASYFISDRFEVYANVDNVSGQKNLVSFRPFGARPGKPRTYTAGMKASF